LNILNLQPGISTNLYIFKNDQLQYSDTVSYRQPTRKINLPLSNYHIILNGSFGQISKFIQIRGNLMVNFEPPIKEVPNYVIDLDTALRANQVGISVSSDYLDNFLKGALIIVQSIIITEIIVMLIIIFANFLEIIRYMVVESKRELKILYRMGASKAQVLIGFTKPLFLASTFIPLITLLLSDILIRILFQFDLTVFFGHQFTPTVYNPVIIITNYIITIGLILFSTSLALNYELFTDDHGE